MKKIGIFFVCLSCFFLISFLSVFIFPNPAVKLLVGLIGYHTKSDISFKPAGISFFKEWHLENIKVAGKNGYALNIARMTVKPKLYSLYKGEIGVNSRAEGVIITKGTGLLDSVCNLLSIRPFGDTVVDVLEADLIVKKKQILMRDLKAVGKDIMVTGSGLSDTGTGYIDYDLRFFFSQSIMNDVPDGIKAALLKKEDNSWMSFALKASGNYKKPSLNFKAPLISLDIKGIR